MNEKLPHHFLSLIIPVYKQEKTIVKNIHQITTVLDNIRYDYEVIIVIDGLVDDSYKNLKMAHFPKVETLAYRKNQGKSYAIRLGMQKAKGDFVMFLDSGMEINPNGISMLLEHMEWYNADIIVGSKRHLASQVEYSWTRKILSYGYYLLVKLLFGIKIHDTQAGIKIFKRNVLEKVLPRLLEKKFAGDLEILVVADSLGFKRIFEAPIKLNYNLGNITTAGTFKAIAEILIDTLSIFYRNNILHYYQRSHRRFISPKKLRVIK